MAERLIRRKLRAGMQEKEAVQLRKLAALFTEATGVSDVTRLRQADCARFREVRRLILAQPWLCRVRR